MKKLTFLTFLLFSFVCVKAQFPYHIYTPQWYDKLRVDSLFWLNSRDTLQYPATTYPGSLVYRQQTGDTAFYFSNGRSFQKFTSQGNVILNQSSNQAGATFNIDHGIITQGAITTGTQALSVVGGIQNGIAGLAGGGVLIQCGPGNGAGRIGGGVNIQTGFAGTTTSGTTAAAAGGDFFATLGAGGGNTSSTSGAVSGRGGSFKVTAGNAGTATNAAVSGEPGYIQLIGGNNSTTGSGHGGIIALTPGTHASGVNGSDGDVFLGINATTGVAVGRIVVGSIGAGTSSANPDFNTKSQRFQVYGSSYFSDSIIANTVLTVPTLVVTTAPAAGKVLTSNASGVGTWQTPSSTPGALKDFYTTVGNSSTTANTFTALYQFTLPANTLTTDGDKITGVYGGTFASNDNNKSLEVLISGNGVVAGPFPSNGTPWEGRLTFIRTGTTTGRALFTVTGYTPSQVDLTGLNYTGTIQFDLWGAGGGAVNDVIAKLGFLMKTSAAP